MRRAPLILSALAVLIAATGITPSEAARAVARALNADRVDGLSASRTPRAGHLLALDRNRRFPSSVLPSKVRGPRGAEGPAGPPGATGPSEGYITRRGTTPVPIPFGAPAIVAELRLPTGAFALDFVAHPFNGGAGQFIDCALSANGQEIVKTATLVGASADAVTEAPVAMTEAARFDTPTVLRALCSARSAGATQMPDIRLRAIRLGSLTEQ